jgi:uncharacterized protein (TIGR00251 family)
MSCRFAVRLTPRGGRDAVDGVDDEGRLSVRVSAPPVDGAANDALVRLLARVLGVPRGTVSIESGVTGRVKRLRIEDVAPDVLIARWPTLVVS